MRSWFIPAAAGSDGSVSRRGFIRGGAATAAIVAGVSLGGQAQAQAAARAGTKQQFVAIQDHENEHVTFLVGALGAAARPKPNFKNLVSPNLGAFLQLSQALENTGVGAYLGATPGITNVDFLGAAASIALIEARHAGYLNGFRSGLTTLNVFGTEQVFETPLTQEQVFELASPYIEDLNGGPPLTFSPTRPADPAAAEANDIAILNFALALEYLEAEYYNLNVPKFFG